MRRALYLFLFLSLGQPGLVPLDIIPGFFSPIPVYSKCTDIICLIINTFDANMDE